MHSKIFLYPTVETKHRKGLLGAHLDCFFTWMQEYGYARHTVIKHIECVGHFGQYLKRRGIHDIHRLEGVEGQKLMATYRKYWIAKGHQDDVFGIALYIRALKEAGILNNLLSRDSLLFPQTQQHIKFLKDQKGLAKGSIDKHKYWVEKFLRFLGCQNGASSLPSFGITHVDDFIKQESVRLKRKTQMILVWVLRSFLRFLYQSGKLTTDLSYLVTNPRCYRLESIPCVLRWDKVQKVLNSVNRSTKTGLRDYAILMLLSNCGLRAGEVARLKFENISWRKNIIYIAPGKTGKDNYLPLLTEVGTAIVEYLKHVRPPSKYREVFLSIVTPKAPITANNIGRIARQYIKLAGFSPSRQGAHVMRHSFATHLKRKGVPSKHISDLIGHRNPESTHLYTKTATDDLREVALEVPEEVQQWNIKW